MRNVRFAVLDLETTGLFPGGTDRVVEVAVVHLDRDGSITGSWQTLVNPNRDLGPQSVHGIRAADVLAAPCFPEIAGQLVRLLRDRVLVGHNVGFDYRFLEAEFGRMDVALPLSPDDALCTMHLAGDFLPGAGRSLADCCAAFDIQLENAHCALHDAAATAQLLASYLRQDPSHWIWDEYARRANRAWPEVPVLRETGVARRRADDRRPHFLERIVDRLPETSGPAAHVEYLALLDRCMLDRYLSESERTALVDLANRLGIERSACQRLHGVYFEQLIARAWEDGELSGAERDELRAAAALLAIPETAVASAFAGPPERNVVAAPEALRDAMSRRFCLQAGDRIVLTGEMRRTREEWHELLEARGFQPWPAVTKKVKLVAAADPDSLSGKARKARDYGIPIVDEAGLEALLAR